jgi:tetratricopeptide (TPR) repeat protein
MICSAETLAIKSLVIHSSLPHNHPTATSQPKGEEADRLIATALRKDPYSHITHHVHSIILRADKDFFAAGNALRRAREIDPDNIPLIRDSISLYTQLKQYDEAQQARIKYHSLRPNMKANWITLAVGYELCGQPEQALTVFEQLSASMSVSLNTGYLTHARLGRANVYGRTLRNQDLTMLRKRNFLYIPFN